MAADPPGDNGRVTLAVLSTKLDALTADVATLASEFRAWRDDCDHRMRTAEEWSTTSRERWRQHEAEHADMRSKRNAGDIVAYVAAVVAAALGIAVKTP